MKRAIIYFVALVYLIFISTGYVSANAGPVYFPGTNAFEIYSKLNSLISVESEDLLFDFRNGDGKAQVKYVLKNNSNDKVKEEIMFPFQQKLGVYNFRDSNDEYKILFGNKEVNFEIILGDTVDSIESGEFSDMLKSVIKDDYQYKRLKNVKYLELKKFKVKNDSRKRLEFYLFVPKDIIFVEQKVFDRFYLSDKGVEFTSDLSTDKKEKELILIVAKSEKNKDIVAKIRSRETKQDLNIDFEEETKEILLEEYVKNHIDDKSINVFIRKYLQKNQLVNLSKKIIDNYRLEESNLSSELQKYRIMFLKCEIELEANEEKELIINYPVVPERHRVGGSSYKNAINYYLNPAKNWKSFKDLKITIIPDNNNKYLLNSSLKFTYNNGKYHYISNVLPEKDLYFEMYHSKYELEKYIVYIFFGLVIAFIGIIYIIMRKYI